MDMIMSVFTRTMNCLEGICDDIECNIDSGCCHTHKQIHSKDSIKENLDKNNELKNDLKKSIPNIE